MSWSATGRSPPPAACAVVNQFFERVPAEFVTSYVTDRGRLAPAEIAAAARSA